MGLAREGRGAWSRQRRSWASRECIGVSKRHEKVLMWRIGTITSRKGRMVLRDGEQGWHESVLARSFVIVASMKGRMGVRSCRLEEGANGAASSEGCVWA